MPAGTVLRTRLLALCCVLACSHCAAYSPARTVLRTRLLALCCVLTVLLLRNHTLDRIEHTPISYDKISAFCDQFEMVFVQTSAKRAICPGMDDISDLVAVEFNRADEATGEIAVRDVDGPFLLGTLMALDPDNTLDNLHTCCL